VGVSGWAKFLNKEKCNHMIKRMVFVFFIIYATNVFAQTTGGSSYNEIPKIIPPSPNAAALEKFGVIPVDYSTGVPSISYPMWNWQRGKLQFNIGLVYHAGGHKVDDMASNVGLGWTTTGIGRISRTVRGLPDDLLVRGFLYSDILPQVSTSQYMDEYINMGKNIQVPNSFLNSNVTITPINTSQTTFGIVEQIANGELDGEQDIFSYSFNNHSGRFIFDHDKNIIPLEQTNIKFEALYSSYSNGTIPNGYINAFKVTEDNGMVYKFDYLEYQNTQNISSDNTITATPPSGNGVSGWLLTQMKDPLTNESIYINYSNGLTQYEIGWSESESNDLEECIVNGSQSFCRTALLKKSNIVNYQLVSGNDVIPNSVNFPDGSLLSFEYNHARSDLNNSNALTKVLVKNNRNEIVKQFALSYSYFNSVTGMHDPTITINDNTKRLRLDGVAEISNNNTITKPTQFIYNNTSLNCRGSKNVDFWGYNVNPNRNNGQYLPIVPLEQTEIDIIKSNGILFQLSLDGADKKPDADFSKAAILERINYPTGGFTSFEYECNKAFSPINYYEDKLISNTPEWYQNSFNQNIGINFPSRVKTSIEFLFKTEEFNPRPPASTSGTPLTCFAENQDLTLASFEISSINESFPTITVTDIYSNFLSGVKKVIDLPLNTSFRVKFVYNPSATCAFQYPFKANCKGTYYVPLYDKLAGGLRIKKIVSDNGSGSVLTKEYSYSNLDGNSSATLNEIPNFKYHRHMRWGFIFLSNLSSPSLMEYDFTVRSIQRSSSPTNTINYFNGSPLLYSRVIEKEKDNSSTERQYSPFVSVSTGGSGYYPNMPAQDFPNLSGLMTKEIIKDNIGNIKIETSLTHNKNQVQLLNEKNRNIKVGSIASNFSFKGYAADQFYMYTTRAEQTGSTTKIYENGNILTNTETKTYDPIFHYLKSTTTYNSNNSGKAKIITYSGENSGTSAYNLMISKNILSTPINIQTIKIPLVINTGVLSQSITNYGLFQNNTLPMPSSVQSSILGNSLQTDITFNDYDNKGNLLQYTAKNGIITSFLWGYNQQYPVAKVDGATFASISSLVNQTTLNNPLTTDVQMQQALNNIRTGLANTKAFVTTYTYSPLIGITSETDPNGRTKYYEYDAFNRLSIVRDQDNNILKKICYNYAGQVENCCPTNSPANWQNTTAPPTCEQLGCGFTGNQLQQQMDMNTCSATHGTKRIIKIANPTACPASTLSTVTYQNIRGLSGFTATYTHTITGQVYTFPIPQNATGTLGCLPAGLYTLSIANTAKHFCYFIIGPNCFTHEGSSAYFGTVQVPNCGSITVDWAN
jgi:YD repeat-containing protein